MNDEKTFANWLERVEILIQGEIGLGIDDLPDYRYHDDYDAGLSPGETADNCLMESGMSMDI